MHESMTANEYINHHLISYSIPSNHQEQLIDFSFVNIDTLFFTVLLGGVVSYLLRLAATRVTTNAPNRFQAAIELLYEFVDGNCQDMIHNPTSRKLVAPLGLVLLVWICFMNAMDLLPVDLLPWTWQGLLGDHGVALRVVPTADLNTAIALSVSVLILCLYYSIKIKGLKGWMRELCSVPFGAKIWLALPNLLMNIIEYLSKTLSHGMRLWGNMYAGEIVFMVIALLAGACGTLDSFLGEVGVFLLHILLGSAWAIFHILIIFLQAYLFMMLAFVYIGQAHDAH